MSKCELNTIMITTADTDVVTMCELNTIMITTADTDVVTICINVS